MKLIERETRWLSRSQVIRAKPCLRTYELLKTIWKYIKARRCDVSSSAAAEGTVIVIGSEQVIMSGRSIVVTTVTSSGRRKQGTEKGSAHVPSMNTTNNGSV